jgi:glycine cleavage system H protein
MLPGDAVDLPENLKYTESHEWVADNGDGTVTVGITAVAAEQLGDLVYVELPQSGTKVTRGGICAVVESTKAASEVYAPVAGEVLESNTGLSSNPERVNQSPYKEGWLFKIKIANRSELDNLLARDAYAKSAGV